MGIPISDRGTGPVILVVHPGFDDGSSWTRVARTLSHRFRVIVPQRRQYRAAAKIGGPVSVAEEVREMLAIAEAVGESMLIVGHSSGGIVALETILAASAPVFVGAVIYEPPLVIGPRLGGQALERARAALSASRPGKAMQIFARDIAGASPALAWLTRGLVALKPNYRRRVVHQLDDVQAIDELGDRLEAYREIRLPVIVLQGSRSPESMIERSRALAHVLPDARRIVLGGQGHAAHLRAPGKVAATIADFADYAFSRRGRSAPPQASQTRPATTPRR